MKFEANVTIMPLKALLDPQGKAVTASMKYMDLEEIDNVRIGKHITLTIDAENENSARQKIEKACKDLLSNPIMESFEIVLKELQEN